MAKGDAEDIKKDKKSVKPVENRRPDGRFGPHNNANPMGRPKKGQTLTDLMREYLDDKEEGHTVPRKVEFVASVASMARKGDATAIKLIWNYLDGMPLQKTDMTAYIKRDFEDMSDEELKEALYDRIKKLPKSKDD